MYAVIPHRDTCSLLARVQKEVLEDFNCIRAQRCESGEAPSAGLPLACPLWPLWAFTEERLERSLIEGLEILPPRLEKGRAFFPVQLALKGAARPSLPLKIEFGTILNCGKADTMSAPPGTWDELARAFPRKERVFKIARAVLKNNSWEAFDEKWVRLSRSKRTRATAN